MADANQDAAKVAEDRRKAREAARKDAEKTLDDQDAERAKANTERDKRESGSKPTPTQREIDLARLGSPVMEKEDDGSGPDPHNQSLGTVKRDVTAANSAGTYKTRGAEGEKKL